tara:strand:- start:247 stop:804 length:558 start_codon:yes stop_codon:yes gene_type:complete
MATILDVIKGLGQAASNAYDGYENMDDKIGLRREDGDPILDSRVIDGFNVRFAGNKMVLSYQSEVLVKELHPRNQFENDVERRLADIVKFLKKEYKIITKNSITLKEASDIDILVQSTSRARTWVQASKQYEISGMGAETDPVRQNSEAAQDKAFEKQFKDFLDQSSNKRSPNDKAPKNPETPKG